MSIDELSECFSNSAIITLHNPSPYKLYVSNRALHTQGSLEAQTVVGELTGNPAYIWETRHNEYILIEDELVLDVQQHKTNMLNHVREENWSENLSNCYIRMRVSQNGDTRFYLVTKADIYPHQELVYSTFDFSLQYE